MSHRPVLCDAADGTEIPVPTAIMVELRSCPRKPNGSYDYGALNAYIRFLVRRGFHGSIVIGVADESVRSVALRPTPIRVNRASRRTPLDDAGKPATQSVEPA
jgi:hypothetical protein